MKRTICIVLIVALLGCCGCTATPAANQEPEPTPEPEGLMRVYGELINVALASESEMFNYGAAAQAEALGVSLKTVDALPEGTATDIDAVVAYMPTADELSTVTVPVIAYTGDSGIEPANGAAIAYDSAKGLDMALDVMFTYVSHEAPVRLVCMYADGMDGAAAAKVADMRDGGKLHVKGELSVEENGGMGEVKSALAAQLEDIIPGLLDTLFTSDAELAMCAYDVLRAARRSDAVEVITAGLNMDIVNAMAEEHFLMGAAVGANEFSAGALAVRMALKYLAGEDVQNETVEPFTLYSDDVHATFSTPTDVQEDIMAMLLNLDERTNALYQTGSIEYLTEYYG